ncbi:hypothetical protein HK098_002119 [Nowakowskiella sp. JEL0407]|nr:hypothetical protein HK098_002119 [Nowakowskiella sp. JEL0407]
MNHTKDSQIVLSGRGVRPNHTTRGLGHAAGSRLDGKATFKSELIKDFNFSEFQVHFSGFYISQKIGSKTPQSIPLFTTVVVDVTESGDFQIPVPSDLPPSFAKIIGLYTIKLEYQLLAKNQFTSHESPVFILAIEPSFNSILKTVPDSEFIQNVVITPPSSALKVDVGVKMKPSERIVSKNTGLKFDIELSIGDGNAKGRKEWPGEMTDSLEISFEVRNLATDIATGTTSKEKVGKSGLKTVNFPKANYPFAESLKMDFESVNIDPDIFPSGPTSIPKTDLAYDHLPITEPYIFTNSYTLVITFTCITTNTKKKFFGLGSSSKKKAKDAEVIEIPLYICTVREGSKVVHVADEASKITQTAMGSSMISFPVPGF